MNESTCEHGVHLIDSETRVDGLRSAFRLATDALDRGLYGSVAVVSPQRVLSLGYRLGETRCTLSLFSASDMRLNEWWFDWRTTKAALEKLIVGHPPAWAGLMLSNSIGRESWYSDDLLQSMYERGHATLQIWDLGTDGGEYLPCINGEAKRREICVLVVRAGKDLASDGEVLPNLQEISIYERCLALIRSAEKISPSLIQRTFSVSWREAARLMLRLEKEGIVRESAEGTLPYEVVWQNVPKGPKLA